MKKLFLILVISLPIISCHTTKGSSSSNTTSRPASNTALQGDSMKMPVKP